MLKYIEISKTGRQQFTWLFKIVFSLFLLILLYCQFNSKISLSVSWNGFVDSLNSSVVLLICAVILLMLLNWGIETRKWQLLIKTTEPLNFLQAFKAVVCGVTASMFTPNRTAEFFGRMLYLKHENRLKSVSLSITGGIAQWIATLVMGTVALLFSVSNSFHLYISHFFIQPAIPVLFIGCCVSLVVYYKISALYHFLVRVKWLNKLIIKMHPEALPVSVLNRILFLSFLRYFVFLAQYFILLKAFGVNMDLIEGVTLISLILLTITLAPTIGLSEMGIRSNVALFFLSGYSSNEWAIVISALLIWIINLLIPSMAGGIFVLRFKTSHSNYEKALA